MTITDVKKDRMRYTKNKISATLCYIAILFNALYFVSIYSTDVGKYYYTLQIGVSVIYNLLFMLFVFLSSEEVKSYNFKYSIVLVVIGALQIVRIFGIPYTAYISQTSVGIKMQYAMEMDQLLYCSACLVISAVCAIVSGIIGMVKTKKLRNYEKTLVNE